jgi:hypothetical protein
MKHLLKTLLLGGLLLLQANLAQAAEITTARRADIERLLSITHAMQTGQQLSEIMVRGMNNMIKSAHPNIPPKVLDAVPEIVNQTIREQLPALTETVIALYAQYYSEDDIKSLIAFYSSDIGKKSIEVTPLLMRDSMSKGMQWGQSLAPQIRQHLQDRFKKDNIDI